MHLLYFEIFGFLLISLIATGMWVTHLVKKTKIIKIKPATEQEKQRFIKWEKRIDIAAAIFTACYWIFMVITCILDVPYLLTDQLYGVVGTVIDGDDADAQESDSMRSITIECEHTSEEIRIHYDGFGISEGEYVAARYLPHTKRGYIIARGDS